MSAMWELEVLELVMRKDGEAPASRQPYLDGQARTKAANMQNTDSWVRCVPPSYFTQPAKQVDHQDIVQAAGAAAAATYERDRTSTEALGAPPSTVAVIWLVPAKERERESERERENREEREDDRVDRAEESRIETRREKEDHRLKVDNECR